MFWVILWIYATFLLFIVLPYILEQYQPNLLVQNHGKLEVWFLILNQGGPVLSFLFREDVELSPCVRRMLLSPNAGFWPSSSRRANAG